MKNVVKKPITDTKVNLLKDDEGEYINLKKKFNDQWIETSFYIDGMDFKMREDQIYATLHGDTTSAIPNSIWSVEFKCKKNDDGDVVNMTTIPKEMTKEEIEKELGYKIEIVEGKVIK